MRKPDTYWVDVVAEALEVASVPANEAQIEEIASWVEGAHEAHSQCFGLDVASANFHASREQEVSLLRTKLREEEEKIPCPACANKRIPSLNGEMAPAVIACDNCNRTGKVPPGGGKYR